MSKKSFLTRSAKERAKLQKKQAARIDKLVNKKVKQYKKAFRRKVAGKLAKIVGFVAIAAMTGAVVAKGKEIIRLMENEKLKQIFAKWKAKQEQK